MNTKRIELLLVCIVILLLLNFVVSLNESHVIQTRRGPTVITTNRLTGNSTVKTFLVSATLPYDRNELMADTSGSKAAFINALVLGE